MMEYLFVYGTLLPDFGPSSAPSLIEQATRIGPAFASGRLYDLGEYPGAVFEADEVSRVHGQVFQLPNNLQILAALDEYEGYFPADPDESLFIRTRIQITMSEGNHLHAWTYAYHGQPAEDQLILGGDYLEWKTGENA